MKTPSGRSVFLASALAAAALLAYVYVAQRGLVVAATVNGKPITRLAVIQQLEKKAGQRMLDEMIAHRLITEAAASAGIVVDEPEIATEIDKVKDQFKAEGMDFDQVFNQKEGRGMTLAGLRASITENLLFNKFIRKVAGDRVVVTQAEVDTYLAQPDGLLPRAVPRGMTKEDYRKQVYEELTAAKLQGETSKWMMQARATSDIKFHVWYSVPDEPTVAEAH